MVKKIVRKILNSLGYEITKLNPTVERKSVKSNKLSFYKTSTGNYYLPTDAVNDIVAATIINNGIFEKEVVEVAEKYIKEGSCVLDVGSNFGQMSILFSRCVGNTGNVYAFDADDWIFEILKKNITANGLDNIIIPNFGAVHNVFGETLIFPDQDFEEFGAYGSYGIDYNAVSGRKVQSITIDSLNIEKPISFMKIDIQGGDLQAMEGAIKTIQKNRMPIIFEYGYHFEDKFKMKFQDYVNFVLSIDYKIEKV